MQKIFLLDSIIFDFEDCLTSFLLNFGLIFYAIFFKNLVPYVSHKQILSASNEIKNKTSFSTES